jgi:hypothetical protein
MEGRIETGDLLQIRTKFPRDLDRLRIARFVRTARSCGAATREFRA